MPKVKLSGTRFYGNAVWPLHGGDCICHLLNYSTASQNRMKTLHLMFFLSLLLQHQRTLHCGAIFHGRRNIVLKPSLLSRPLSPYWSSFLFPPPSIVLFAHLRPRVSFPQTVPPAKSVAAFILDPNDPNNNDGHLNFFNATAPPRTNQNWAQHQTYNVSHFTEKKMNLCESSDDDSPQSKLYTVKSKGKKKRNKKSSEVWICLQNF